MQRLLRFVRSPPPVFPVGSPLSFVLEDAGIAFPHFRCELLILHILDCGHEGRCCRGVKVIGASFLRRRLLLVKVATRHGGASSCSCREVGIVRAALASNCTMGSAHSSSGKCFSISRPPKTASRRGAVSSDDFSEVPLPIAAY